MSSRAAKHALEDALILNRLRRLGEARLAEGCGGYRAGCLLLPTASVERLAARGLVKIEVVGESTFALPLLLEDKP